MCNTQIESITNEPQVVKELKRLSFYTIRIIDHIRSLECADIAIPYKKIDKPLADLMECNFQLIQDLQNVDKMHSPAYLQ